MGYIGGKAGKGLGGGLIIQASSCRQVKTIYDEFYAVTPENNQGLRCEQGVLYTAFNVTQFAFRLVLILLVGCRLYLLGLILS